MEHINDFGVVGGLELLCWVVETILFPNNHMTTSCIESRWNLQHIRLQVALLFWGLYLRYHLNSP